jgi:hypothetical protein
MPSTRACCTAAAAAAVSRSACPPPTCPYLLLLPVCSEDVYTRKLGEPMRNGVPAAATDLMTPPSKAGQLGPAAAFPVCEVPRLSEPKCSHEVITVKPGATTLLRLINAATLVYMTVCVGGHSVTLVALDGNPVAPRTFSECVDINSGQRWVGHLCVGVGGGEGGCQG